MGLLQAACWGVLEAYVWTGGAILLLLLRAPRFRRLCRAGGPTRLAATTSALQLGLCAGSAWARARGDPAALLRLTAGAAALGLGQAAWFRSRGTADDRATTRFLGVYAAVLALAGPGGCVAGGRWPSLCLALVPVALAACFRLQVLAGAFPSVPAAVALAAPPAGAVAPPPWPVTPVRRGDADPTEWLGALAVSAVLCHGVAVPFLLIGGAHPGAGAALTTWLFAAGAAPFALWWLRRAEEPGFYTFQVQPHASQA